MFLTGYNEIFINPITELQIFDTNIISQCYPENKELLFDVFLDIRNWFW